MKISGKLVGPESPSLVKEYVEILHRLWSRKYLKAVVVGGGKLSRDYIGLAREAGASKALQDIIGIEASRLKARILVAALWPLAYPEPPRTLYEVLEAYATGRLVVVGGFQPGQSTATVASLIAEALGAERLVLASTVDGVYDRDPAKHPDAKLIECLDYDSLLHVLSTSLEPGRYELLDPYAVSILRRSGVEAIVVNGRDPRRVYEAVVKGRPSRGTVVLETCPV